MKHKTLLPLLQLHHELFFHDQQSKGRGKGGEKTMIFDDDDDCVYRVWEEEEEKNPSA